MTEDHRMPVLMPESTLAQEQKCDRRYSFTDVLRAIIAYPKVPATCLPPHNREGNLPETTFNEAVAWCRLKYPDMGRLEYILPSLKKEHIADFASRNGMKRGVRYLLVELGFRFHDERSPLVIELGKSNRTMSTEMRRFRDNLLLKAIGDGVSSRDGLMKVLEANGFKYLRKENVTTWIYKLAKKDLIAVGRPIKKGLDRNAKFYPLGRIPEGYEQVLSSNVGQPKHSREELRAFYENRPALIIKAIEAGYRNRADIRSYLFQHGDVISDARCHQVLSKMVEEGAIECHGDGGRDGFVYRTSLCPPNEDVKQVQESLNNELLHLYRIREAS